MGRKVWSQCTTDFREIPEKERGSIHALAHLAHRGRPGGKTRVHPPPAGAGLSAAGVRRAKALLGGILLDGAPVFTNAVARQGQVLAVDVGDAAGSEQIAPVPGPLTIVYEDQDLVILDKAGGVPVHPSQGHHGDTLANFLLAHYRDQGLTAAFHPVNRLDRGTSGLMAVAKHAHAHEGLQHQLQEGTLRRAYLAVCEGVPVPRRGCVEAPIARGPGSVLKREVNPQGARPGPTTKSWPPAGGGAWWPSGWTPGAPTRSGSTWRTWAVLWWGTSSTGRRRRNSPIGLRSTRRPSGCASPSPGRGLCGGPPCRRPWRGCWGPGRGQGAAAVSVGGPVRTIAGPDLQRGFPPGPGRGSRLSLGESPDAKSRGGCPRPAGWFRARSFPLARFGGCAALFRSLGYFVTHVRALIWKLSFAKMLCSIFFSKMRPKSVL